MRAIVAAIALVFAIGVVMPTEAHARAPRTAERWGCTFMADLALLYGTEDGWNWIGAGDIACDVKQTFTVRMAMLRDTPGTPDRLVNSDTWVVWDRPREPMSPESLKLPGGWCRSTRPAYPYYFRMKVENKNEPGSVWLATANGANPCPDGQWPGG